MAEGYLATHHELPAVFRAAMQVCLNRCTSLHALPEPAAPLIFQDGAYL